MYGYKIPTHDESFIYLLCINSIWMKKKKWKVCEKYLIAYKEIRFICSFVYKYITYIRCMHYNRWSISKEINDYPINAWVLLINQSLKLFYVTSNSLEWMQIKESPGSCSAYTSEQNYYYYEMGFSHEMLRMCNTNCVNWHHDAYSVIIIIY